MIITAGDLKGKRIVCPDGKEIRPTSSKIRQAIFNILYSMGVQMPEVRMLELFAGTGIVSLEAVSRGARSSVLVDSSTVSMDFARKNIRSLGLEDRVSLVRHDVLEYVRGNYLKDFDLVFMDPPYRYPNYTDVIKETAGKMKDGAILMAESGSALFKEGEQEGIRVVKVKSWGQTFVTFMKRD